MGKKNIWRNADFITLTKKNHLKHRCRKLKEHKEKYPIYKQTKTLNKQNKVIYVIFKTPVGKNRKILKIAREKDMIYIGTRKRIMVNFSSESIQDTYQWDNIKVMK